MQERQLTPNFSLSEFTFSSLAIKHKINNELPEKYMVNAIATAMGLERCRKLLNRPIIIISGYRCTELNKVAGGVGNSQHGNAQAADIVCPKYGPVQSVALMLASQVGELGIDQLIYEYDSWVHVSFTDKPRNEILTIKEDQRKYLQGIVL
jgi:hypothetical protein